MNKKIPFNTRYSTIRKFEITAYYFLIASAIIVTIVWLEPQLNFTDEFRRDISPYVEILQTLIYAIMIGYWLLTLIAKFLFKEAEKYKRDDLIDNSFGSKYSNDNTEGYYNNEDSQYGMKRLALNTYESSFHTENTLSKMLYRLSIKVLIISVPFVISIFSQDGSGVVRLLFKISIPLMLITELALTLSYYYSVKNINERFKIELLKIGKNKLKIKDYSSLLIPIMRYYCVKSWANINLSETIFNKYNESISEKWIAIKDSLK